MLKYLRVKYLSTLGKMGFKNKAFYQKQGNLNPSVLLECMLYF